MTNNSLTQATALLKNNGYTCVFCHQDTVWVSREHGVKPLLDRLYAEDSICGFYAADRVVGKAAAFLYILLEIRALYAEVLSIPAKQTLERYGIPVTYGCLIDSIRNQTGDGLCPMEQSVWKIDSPQEALKTIEKTRILLLSKNSPHNALDQQV